MGNTINVQGSYIDIHDNENVYLSVDKAEVKMGQAVAEKEPAKLTEDLLGKAVGGVKEYIWGHAAYAVLLNTSGAMLPMRFCSACVVMNMVGRTMRAILSVSCSCWKSISRRAR